MKLSKVTVESDRVTPVAGTRAAARSESSGSTRTSTTRLHATASTTGRRRPSRQNASRPRSVSISSEIPRITTRLATTPIPAMQATATPSTATSPMIDGPKLDRRR